ncbi:MAG: bifunctional DNA-formamidopyrimidine glycosylase/DNA-(apurinic or apyrimidinic site) lyase [Syntrophaceae bacterium]|nr:bifunctional DNA-formamidopyrimidine glycosylase/DNA-(apurinic or apyrimidinic site) lyase [Syntrophaceae bacterium]
MPELPEVETVVRGLRKRIVGWELSRVEVHQEKCLGGVKSALAGLLRKKKILAIDRRGKNIILCLSGGGTVFVHLGMSGRLRLLSGSAPREKHTHLVFSFLNREDQLRFIDPRRFGRVSWGGEEKGPWGFLSRLGPEALEISPAEFVARARARRREIKPLLLDQHFLAGVGNIYADESLHRAGIHPRRRSDSLSPRALFRLHRALQQVLKEAIAAGGTSVRSYVDSKGVAGGYQHSLRAYGREGSPCPACFAKIVREIVGGRSSFYCPRCQRRNSPRRKK